MYKQVAKTDSARNSTVLNSTLIQIHHHDHQQPHLYRQQFIYVFVCGITITYYKLEIKTIPNNLRASSSLVTFTLFIMHTNTYTYLNYIDTYTTYKTRSVCSSNRKYPAAKPSSWNHTQHANWDTHIHSY